MQLARSMLRAVEQKELRPVNLQALDRAHLHDAYRAGAPATAAIEFAYDRMAAVADPGVFIHLVARGDARAAAARLPAFDPTRFPLWGLPFAVKDNIDVAGLPTTAGCPAFASLARETAPAVAKLLAAGAILIGKTNLDQFATGLVGVRTPYPVPRNPFDASRAPGGSSSGSAVAVAQRFATFALGTDTAGSGRIPAAFNNVVGLKPSLGAISPRGVVPACRTLDCVSVFAATVDDALAAFEVAAGYDAREPYSRRVVQSERRLERVGVPLARNLTFFGDGAAARAWEASLAHMRARGFVLVEVAIDPLLEAAKLLYDGPWVAERGVAAGGLLEHDPDAIHPVTRAILRDGEKHSAVSAFRAFYELARHRRAAEELFDEVDALAVATAPIFPTLEALAADPFGPNSRLGTYTNFVNLLDLAAVAAPGPFRADGLPAGVTFVAPAGFDRALAGLARRFFPSVGGAARLPSASAA
jgi:allophanate hydrolase